FSLLPQLRYRECATCDIHKVLRFCKVRVAPGSSGVIRLRGSNNLDFEELSEMGLTWWSGLVMVPPHFRPELVGQYQPEDASPVQAARPGKSLQVPARRVPGRASGRAQVGIRHEAGRGDFCLPRGVGAGKEA